MTTVRTGRHEPERKPAEATRPELREQAMIRDGGRCVWCQTLGHAKDLAPILEMARLRGIGAGGRKSADRLDEVAMLCRFHHDLLDGRNYSGKRVEIAGLLAHIVKSRRRIWPTDPAVPVE